MSFVDDLTYTNNKQRRQAINYYANLSEAEKHTVHRLIDRLFHRLRRRANDQDPGEFQYALLIIAIRQYQDQSESGLTERRSTTPAMIAELRQRRIARVIEARETRRAPLAAAIGRYYNDIGEMRTAGLSWPEIAQYIVTHHGRALLTPGRKQVSLDPRYLARVWAQLQQEKTKRPGDL